MKYRGKDQFIIYNIIEHYMMTKKEFYLSNILNDLKSVDKNICDKNFIKKCIHDLCDLYDYEANANRKDCNIIYQPISNEVEEFVKDNEDDSYRKFLKIDNRGRIYIPKEMILKFIKNGKIKIYISEGELSIENDVKNKNHFVEYAVEKKGGIRVSPNVLKKAKFENNKFEIRIFNNKAVIFNTNKER